MGAGGGAFAAPLVGLGTTTAPSEPGEAPKRKKMLYLDETVVKAAGLSPRYPRGDALASCTDDAGAAGADVFNNGFEGYLGFAEDEPSFPGGLDVLNEAPRPMVKEVVDEMIVGRLPAPPQSPLPGGGVAPAGLYESLGPLGGVPSECSSRQGPTIGSSRGRGVERYLSSSAACNGVFLEREAAAAAEVEGRCKLTKVPSFTSLSSALCLAGSPANMGDTA